MNYKEKTDMLEQRIATLESAVAHKKTMNEANPIVAALIKMLPTILSNIPKLIALLDTDKVNDNTEKKNKLNTFMELGSEIVKMFSGENK